MTPLMLVGAILSLMGVAMALGITFYYLSLPMNAPFRVFLDSTVMGLPYLLYFVMVGAVLSATGLLLYIRGVRTGITITARRGYQARTSIRPATRRPATRPPPPRTRVPEAAKSTVSPNIVERIEKEIEEIVRSEGVVEEPETPAEEVERPPIEVVSKATDMVCPHCGSLNPLGSEKCSNCGKKFYKREDPSKSCPVCGAPLRLSKRISEDLFVCGICFSELRIDPEFQKSLKL